MSKLAAVIASLQNNPIEDYTSPAKSIKFTNRNLDLGVSVLEGSIALREFRVHKHAFGQVCTRFGLPVSYANALLRKSKTWATDLLVHNLTEIANNRNPDPPYLLRTVGGQLRGFLSASYKRLDTIRLVEEFSACAKTCGAEPFDAYQTDLRTIVQAAYKGDVRVAGTKIRIGVLFQNSEFGAGCAAVKMFVTSFGRSMVGAGLQRRHRGSKNSTHDSDTLRRDSDVLARDMQDTVLRYLAPENLDAVLAEIELSASLVIDITELEKTLQNLSLNAEEMKWAVETFKSDNANLPQGNTMFRLANTVAWLAENQQDGDKKVDLMQAAGTLVFKEPR